MNRFDLFGARELALVETADVIAGALGIVFELHDSSYVGGEYYRGNGGVGEELLVQPNCEDGEGYLTEPDFKEFSTLVYVNRGNEPLARALGEVSGLEHLRLEII